MNYFAHAAPFLDDPYFVVGTGVPDWLSVVDRGCRVRLRDAERLARGARGLAARVARGAAQHMRDDARFHGTRAFAEIWLELSADCRRHLGPETDHRPAFLGHVLAELLLDAHLISADRGRLQRYYQALDRVNLAAVERAVNHIASRSTSRLRPMISSFRRLQILWDYVDDAKLMVRMDQVLRRVGLAPLPPGFAAVLPAARRKVAGRSEELLAGIPTPGS